MEQQQLATMLSIEKHVYPVKAVRSHPRRRLIADSLNKLHDDEKLSDDVFALTMTLFDRFFSKTSLVMDDRYCQLIALSCHNLAKKLRTNLSVNNENEQTSLILLDENYSDEEIFDAEQFIVETLDWDLSTVVPDDYLSLLLDHILPLPDERAQIRSHVQVLLSLAICELNTLTVRPSVLACACIKAALKGLCLSQIDDSILHTIPCAVKDLLHTQRLVEQFFQSCLQDIFPSPARRCLAVLDTSNTPSAVSPRVK